MPRRSFILIVLCGSLIIGLGMGLRQTFGLFLTPMTLDLGIGREAFSLSMALLNILWGVFQPITGMVADKYGAGRVILAGTVAYVLGLYVMSNATGVIDLHIGAGFLIGFGTAACGFSVVLGAVGRYVPPERRSIAFGIVSAGASIGQFIVLPLGQLLIEAQGWAGALLIMAALAVVMAPLGAVLAGRPDAAANPAAMALSAGSLRSALREATGHRGFWYLNLGFGVCGFQVLFIAIHLPAYLSDAGLSGQEAALALALIGFFNILGTYVFGVLGSRYRRTYLLSLLYLLRAVVISLFLIAPKTEATVMIFAGAIGFLWLATVPLTSDLVAHIFGVRYLGTLFGIVFFGHQIGGFLGVWAGGYLFDLTGSYNAIWLACVALGVIAAVLHMPISEEPVARLPREAV